MTTTRSTPQRAILAHAIDHHDGKLDWFPDNLKGGARKKVLNALFDRALITPLGDDWFVAAEGYDALGLPRPAPITLAKPDAIISNAEAAQCIDADRGRSGGVGHRSQGASRREGETHPRQQQAGLGDRDA